MSAFTDVTDDFAVAAQISAEDIARAAEAGYRTIINNRPDGEAPGQPPNRALTEAAAEAKIDYYALPFAGPPPPELVDALTTLLADSERPILAFCRTGTRSITLWAFAQAKAGALSPDAIIAKAAAAGYDLAAHRPVLERLAAA
jgi:uncharacterized protein (TIGR01244 family)